MLKVYCKTDKQKQELFTKVNNGKIRVLLGSTSKMGTGTNCQQRLKALHHIDCPYRPSDLQQRNGRLSVRAIQTKEIKTEEAKSKPVKAEYAAAL